MDLILEKLSLKPANVLDRLTWTGSTTIKHGNLIIRNNTDSKNWMAICYHLSSYIYLCL